MTAGLPPALVEEKSSPRETVSLINRMRDVLAQVITESATGTTKLTAAPAVIWTSDDMPQNTVRDIEITVLAIATDGSAGWYRRIARVIRLAGGAVLRASTILIGDTEDVAGWDVTVATSGNGVTLAVTGDATRTVQWSALMRTRELKRT